MKKEKCLCLLMLLNFLVLCLLSATPCYASWAKLYSKGIDYNNLERGNSIIQTKDGGFIIAGSTGYFTDTGGIDFKEWVLKLKPDGSIEWEKAYDSNDPFFIGPSSIHETSDGGYIVLVQNWLLKLRPNGDTEWLKLFKPGVNAQGELTSLQQTSDSGYIVSGWDRRIGTYNDFLVLKLNSQGGIVWQKAYGGQYDDTAYSIIQTPDSEYVVAGITESFGGGEGSGIGDLWVIKLDSEGTVIWQKAYGGGGYDGYNTSAIQVTSDGGYIVFTNTSSFGAGDWDIWVIKLNANGSVEWERSHGGQYPDVLQVVNETSDRGYIVTSKKQYLYQDYVLITKFDELGNIVWQRIFADGGGIETPFSVQQTTDGNIVVAGMTGSFNSNGSPCPNCGVQMLFLKLTAQGEIPGCQYLSDHTSLSFNTNATITETNVTPMNTFAYAELADVLTENTAAKITTICDAPNLPDIAIIPTSHDFGSINVGTLSAPQTFTISNTGTGDLHISDITLSDTTNYSLNVNGGSSPCGNTTPTITPDGSCTVTVTFNPLSTGQKDASLTVNSDDPDTQILNVSLSGTGVKQKPIIEKILGVKEPGLVIRIIGTNFGDTQGDSVVHIGPRIFGSSSPSLRLWSDTKIKIRLPNYQCGWFKDPHFRYIKTWVTVDGIDSNKKRLKVMKPSTCPSGGGSCTSCHS